MKLYTLAEAYKYSVLPSVGDMMPVFRWLIRPAVGTIKYSSCSKLSGHVKHRGKLDHFFLVLAF